MRAGLGWIASAALVTACAQVAPAQRVDALARERVPAPPAVQPAATSAATGSPAPGQTSKPDATQGTGASAAGSAPAPELPSPFDESPVIFTVAGPHFTRGERVIVTVCLARDHSISSSYIFESSGDVRFDALAMTWARRIRLRAAAQGEELAACGAVRVEVHPAQEPPVFHAPGDALG